jgi:MarR family 2-MHQ and catechol resistance regulon transcriptional repressor
MSRSTALDLWIALARASRAVGAHVERDAARHRLTAAEFGILEALHRDGPLLLGDLQRKVAVTSGGMTYLANRLASRGLVRRTPSPKDRRARFATLTRTGRTLIARALPTRARAADDALRAIPAEQRPAMIEALQRLGREAEDRLNAAAL